MAIYSATLYTKKRVVLLKNNSRFSGAYGTRTRDLQRDRLAF